MPYTCLIAILVMSGTTQAQAGGFLSQIGDLVQKQHVPMLDSDPDFECEHNPETCDCEGRPASCAWKVKCPGLGMVVKNGILKPHGENGTISQQECLEAMQNGLKIAPETAWLVCLDALFQHVDVFNLPSNHIGNTGIRTNGYINKSAFESLWDQHSSRYDEGEERLMCREDMKRAADFNRQAVSYPGFDTEVFYDWRGTVFGHPTHRDIAPLTMVGIAKLFGEITSTEDGDKYCLNKNDLASIYLENRMPRQPRQMSELDILKDASFAGGIANAQWHIPMIRVTYLHRAIEGTLPPGHVFNNKAILAMWLTGTLDWREILFLVLLSCCCCCCFSCLRSRGSVRNSDIQSELNQKNQSQDGYAFAPLSVSDSQKEVKGPTLLSNFKTDSVEDGGGGIIKKGRTGEAEALITTGGP